jgi:hypothetical protein
MSAKKTGGAAFPRPVASAAFRELERQPRYSEPQDGMTLRDYFAAKAMAAIMTNGTNNGQSLCAGDFPVVAELSYVAADAMLKAREGSS